MQNNGSFPPNQKRYSQAPSVAPVPGQLVYPPQAPLNIPIRPYSKNVFLLLVTFCFLSLLLLGMGSTMIASPLGQCGASLFLGVVVSVLLLDWHGFITLQGWIQWGHITGKKRFWLGLLYLCLFEIVLLLYFFRVALIVFSPAVGVKSSNRVRVFLSLVVGVFVVLIGVVSALATPPARSQGAQKTESVSASPTLAPIPTKVPTATLIAKPTQAPTATLIARPTQVPTPTIGLPTQPPVQTGVNGNPWGYNFAVGNLIYAPPADFCAYFNCIASFWKSTNGYVDECNDTTYSHSGGVTGACSKHDGEMRPLYAHS